MGRHPGTARFHLQARRAGNVHLESALLCREVRASQPRFSLTRRAISRIPHPQRSLLRGRSGLVEHSPAEHVRRTKIVAESATLGLDRMELAAFIAQAAA